MFEELIDKLENCPNVHYEAGVHFIRILPTRLVEFPVMIEWIWGTRFMVHLDGWHQDFDSYAEAAKCFMLAASGRYRLKTGNKGGQRFRWTVEYWDGSRWVEDSTTTDLFYPFWKPTTSGYLRNQLLPVDLPEVAPVVWSMAAGS